MINSLERVSAMTIGDVSINVFGEVAFAYCTFQFEGNVKGRVEPRIANDRNTFLFKRVSGRWRTIHHHESAGGPL